MSQRLHSSIHHPTLRAWNSINTEITAGNKTYICFVIIYLPGVLFLDNLLYPVFITDSDDDAYEAISTLPEQGRHGVNHLVKYLKPLVDGNESLPLKG